jgi:PrtD family type I secretion system ABC transporter
MRSFIKKFRIFFLYAGFFSFVINMLLLTPSIYMLQTYDRVLSSRSMETLFMLTLILGVMLMGMSALEMVRSRLLVKATNAIDGMLAPYLLHKMVAGATSPEGNRYALGLKDLNSIKSFLGGSGIFALFDAPWLPVYLIILYLMSPFLLVIAVIGAVLMLILTALAEYLTRNPLQQANKLGRQAANYVAAALRNAEAVNAMGMLTSLTRRWSCLNSKTLELQNSASHRAGTVSGLTKFVRQFIQSVMLGAGAYLVLQNQGFTAGMMIMGTIILGKALAPIEHVIASYKGLIEVRGAYARLDEFIKAQALELPHMPLPAPSGQIVFEHVTFGIRATNKVIIKDVSFALAAGESLGLIGPSAAGKSSLARLITGVWKPLTGKIRLDGAELDSWSGEALGRHVGYLPQDVELFAGSIADNIARLSEVETDKIISAAKLAGIHEMILRMPNGYDTQIGEGGTVLSGGQRQRVGLARALFDSPRLVVLDEPNASLDADGEQALLQAFFHLKRLQTTVVIITHKTSLLVAVDKLLVVQDGALVTFGPRETVMAQLMKQQQGQPPSGSSPGQQPAPPTAAPHAVAVSREVANA